MSALAMSFGDLRPSWSELDQVPRYWRFHTLRRFDAGWGAFESEDVDEGVEPELEDACGVCGGCIRTASSPAG